MPRQVLRLTVFDWNCGCFSAAFFRYVRFPVFGYMAEIFFLYLFSHHVVLCVRVLI